MFLPVFRLNRAHTHLDTQEEQIYLADTRALHHVLVRDTHVFDETPAMMSYVPSIFLSQREVDSFSTANSTIVSARVSFRFTGISTKSKSHSFMALRCVVLIH